MNPSLEGDLVPARGVVVVGGAAKVLAVVDRLRDHPHMTSALGGGNGVPTKKVS